MKNFDSDEMDRQYGEVLRQLGSDEVRFTENDVIAIHDEGVKRYGGDYGIRDENLFHSVCASPYQEVFGERLCPTPYDKAAYYLFSFANYQVFSDGNKRIGLMAACAYLELCGIELDLTDREAYDLTIGIAKHHFEQSEDVADYLKANSHERDVREA